MHYISVLGCLGVALSSPALASAPEPEAIRTAASADAAAAPAAAPANEDQRREEIRVMRAQIAALAARAEAMETDLDGVAPTDAAARKVAAQRVGYELTPTPDAPPPVASPGRALAALQNGGDGDHKFEIYGFGQVDYIYDFNRVDPAWDDAFRPSKIPTEDGAFGSDGQSSLSAKQSRFGAKASGMAGSRPYEAKFEFDLFGTGVDAGQTTFRLRHAYARWGPVLGGQTNTLFMDGDVFPNVIDYWGPTGMVFVRTPQLRYIISDDPTFYAAVAIEKPGNDIDAGQIRQIDPDLAAGLTNTEKWPDLTGQVRWTGGWGHVQLAGIVRQLGFETVGSPDNEPNGDELGWGLNGTTAFKMGSAATGRLGVVYGEGIASYMNDGGMDMAPRVTSELQPPNLVILRGHAEAVPLLGITAYLDYAWSEHWTSAIGYSLTQVDNTNFQEPTAYHRGEYASANILWTPTPRVMTGAELMWGQRTDNGGAKGDDVRIQVSFKASFTSNDFFNH